jgi:hypothetical protein
MSSKCNKYMETYRVVADPVFFGKWNIRTRVGDHYVATKDTQADAVRFALETESEERHQRMKGRSR